MDQQSYQCMGKCQQPNWVDQRGESYLLRPRREKIVLKEARVRVQTGALGGATERGMDECWGMEVEKGLKISGGPL